MVKEKRLFGKALAVLFLLSVCAIIVSAQISLKNISILKNYGPGQILEGSFEADFTGEPANSQLEISISKGNVESNKTIPLIDILKDLKVNFTCSTTDCGPVYTKGSASKSENIAVGERYIGLVVKNGNNTLINSLSFNITGQGNSESCRVSPLSLDILGDGIVDWQHTEPGEFCDQLSASSTYDSSSASDSYKLGDMPYCEKMALPKAVKFKIGADMVNSTIVRPIIMSINDLDTGDNSECELVPGNGIRTCEVNFTVPSSKDYYVCIQSSDEGDYKISAETKSPNCGKFGLETFKCDDSLIDYAIYAQPASFGIFNGTTAFNSDTFTGFNPQDLNAYLQDYIENKYGANCDGGCIVPIKISSAQNAILSSLSFKYTNNLGTVDSSDFYDLTRKEAEVTTVNYTKIQLSKANFNVPSTYGNYNLRIMAGDEEVMGGSISVDKVPNIKAVTPTIVFAAVSTEFMAFVTSPDNNSISRYDWDFGDGISSTTGIPFTNHTYPTGVFDLTLTATDSKGLSASRTFMISTQQPKDATNLTITMKKANLLKIVSAIDSLPLWYSDMAKNVINLQKIASDLSSLQDEFSSANADYASIKMALDQLVVYSGIEDTPLGVLQVVPIVNVEYLKKLGETVEPGKEEELAQSISAWQAANLEINLKGTNKVAIADTSAADNLNIATIFDITLSSSDGIPKNNIYLIVKLPAGMTVSDARFDSNLTQDLDGAFGMVLDKVDSTSVTFALPGKVDPSELEIFASPTIAIVSNPEVRCGNLICESSFGENNDVCPQDCKKPISSAIWLTILIVIISLAGIFAIWKYYAVYYEGKLRQSLFTKDTDFYNISFFIANEINKGTEESKIRELLAKAEWSPQQIDYALKIVNEQTKKMQKASITNFISEEMKRGKTVAEIRVSLASAGWDRKLIDWAVSKARKSQGR